MECGILVSKSITIFLLPSNNYHMIFLNLKHPSEDYSIQTIFIYWTSTIAGNRDLVSYHYILAIPHTIALLLNYCITQTLTLLPSNSRTRDHEFHPGNITRGGHRIFCFYQLDYNKDIGSLESLVLLTQSLNSYTLLFTINLLVYGTVPNCTNQCTSFSITLVPFQPAHTSVS